MFGLIVYDDGMELNRLVRF